MSHRLVDRALLIWLWGCALLSSGIVGAVVLVTALDALPLLAKIGPWRFLTDPSWHPTAERFNLGPMLAGTLLVSLGGLALAGPLGVASAVFSTFYAPPWLATAYRHLLSTLAGIPSVVFGLWGLVVLVPLIGRVRAPGTSLLAGAIVLGLMVLPTVALVAGTALRQVPAAYLRGAAALGVPHHRVVWRVALPVARRGVLTALIVALGRAVGETMAVLMVTGNVVQLPHSVFDPLRTLAANIALEMAYAMADHRAALFVGSLALTLVIISMLLVAETLSPPETRYED